MPWTIRPVHRIGTFRVVQKLQSDQGSTDPTQGEEILEYCAALPTSPQLPTPTTPPGPGRQEGALKLSAVGFTSSDCFLKQQQQHKVLVWLTGNLKLSRQSSLPPPPRYPPHTHTDTHTLRLPRTPARGPAQRHHREALLQPRPSSHRPRRRLVLGRDLEGKDSGEVRERKPTGDRSWESVLQEKAEGGRGGAMKFYFSNFSKRPARD